MVIKKCYCKLSKNLTEDKLPDITKYDTTDKVWKEIRCSKEAFTF